MKKGSYPKTARALLAQIHHRQESLRQAHDSVPPQPHALAFDVFDGAEWLCISARQSVADACRRLSLIEATATSWAAQNEGRPSACVDEDDVIDVEVIEERPRNWPKKA